MTQPMECRMQGQFRPTTVTIAVVVPLYNKRPHIADTIDSILAQSTPPAEIIVVDDGSTDGSVDIAAQYEMLGVRLIRQTNAGESAARNCGIMSSTSQWIAFLDADDLWLPNHIEALTQVIHSYPALGLVSTQHEIVQDGVRSRPRSAYPLGGMYKVDDFYRRFAVGLSLVNSSTACAKREALLDIGGFPVDVRIGPDIITWIKLFERFGMAHIGIVSAVWQRDAVNRSTSMTSVMPGSLTFLGQTLDLSSGVSSERRKSVAFLFDRIACVTAAGRKLQGDIPTVRKIRNACWRYNRVLAWLAISLLAAVPSPVLRYARHLRQQTKLTIK